MKKLIFSMSFIMGLLIIGSMEMSLYGMDKMGKANQWLKNCAVNQFFEARPYFKRGIVTASTLIPMFAIPEYMRSLRIMVGGYRPSSYHKYEVSESTLCGLVGGSVSGLFAYSYPGFAAVIGAGLLLGKCSSLKDKDDN